MCCAFLCWLRSKNLSHSTPKKNCLGEMQINKHACRHCQPSPTSMPRPSTIMCECWECVCVCNCHEIFGACSVFHFCGGKNVCLFLCLLTGKPEVHGSSQGNQTAGSSATLCFLSPASFCPVYYHQVAFTAFLASSFAWLGAEFLRMRCTSWRISTNCK